MVAKTTLISLLLAASTFSTSAFAPPQMQNNSPSRTITQLSATKNNNNPSSSSTSAQLAAATFAIASSLLLSPLTANADGQTKEFKLPPIDYSDKSRCVLNSSKMGQANAARDKLYDLRECNLSGVKVHLLFSWWHCYRWT
ncbi:hypothetical protein ACHAXM_004756 [Skeletonema potamos]